MKEFANTSLHSEDDERRSHHKSGVVHGQVVEPGDAGAAGIGAIFNRGGRQDRHPWKTYEWKCNEVDHHHQFLPLSTQDVECQAFYTLQCIKARRI